MASVKTAKLQPQSVSAIRRMKEGQARRLEQISRKRAAIKRSIQRRMRASEERRRGSLSFPAIWEDPEYEDANRAELEETSGRRCLRSGDANVFTCLTNSQWAKLFGHTRKDPKRFGCGSFACVYESRNPGRVIKLTTDPGDVHTTMHAQGLPGVVTLYRATAVDTGNRAKRWAMELERLRPVKRKNYKRFNQALGCAADTTGPDTHPLDVTAACCPRTKGRTLESCRRLVRFVHRTTGALRRRGLEFTDWHVGNVGKDAQGRWRLIDLGYNVGYVESRPILRGPKRRR